MPIYTFSIILYIWDWTTRTIFFLSYISTSVFATFKTSFIRNHEFLIKEKVAFFAFSRERFIKNIHPCNLVKIFTRVSEI